MSHEHHQEVVKRLDSWLEHINYHVIRDDIPDREEDAVVNPSLIYIDNVPSRYHKLFTVICTAFHEVNGAQIRLVFRKIPMTMQARPDIWALLMGRRRYVVLINTSPQHNGITIDDIPFNGQLGIIAHEMSHILDYEHKSLWGLIKTGIDYISRTKRAQYEKAIDLLAVRKGFGLQMHTWARFVLEEANVTERYRQTKQRYYLDTAAIKWAWDQMSAVLD
ncbi:MAG: hypothetical protein AAFQ02_07345 [Bacteroidota bacterium]